MQLASRYQMLVGMFHFVYQPQPPIRGVLPGSFNDRFTTHRHLQDF